MDYWRQTGATAPGSEALRANRQLELPILSKIVVDFRAAALAEAGDLIVALEHGFIKVTDIYGELGEIVAGFKSGREQAQEITYFKSVGNAAQDVAVAHAVYDQALKQDLGVEVEL